jgi:hypothetical protein
MVVANSGLASLSTGVAPPELELLELEELLELDEELLEELELLELEELLELDEELLEELELLELEELLELDDELLDDEVDVALAVKRKLSMRNGAFTFPVITCTRTCSLAVAVYEPVKWRQVVVVSAAGLAALVKPTSFVPLPSIVKSMYLVYGVPFFSTTTDGVWLPATVRRIPTDKS